jgi:carbonic anhydrase
MSSPTETPDTQATNPDAAEPAAAGGRLAAATRYLPKRREALFLLGGSVLGGTFAGGAWGASAWAGDGQEATERDDDAKLTSREALRRLTEGNARFVAGTSLHPDQSLERRSAVSEGQSPFAVVLSCADSRVAPEQVFDQGLGDLFVVRSIGQVVDHAVRGTLQYGVSELAAPLVVVLGHSRCGAVKLAVEAVAKKSKPVGNDIDTIISALKPAVEEAEELGATEKNVLNASIGINVEYIVEQLKATPVLSAAAKLRKTKIVGATYDLASGEVEWL